MDVKIFEEHSSVLPELWGRGAGDRTLICLDAHLDLQPINARRLAQLRACASKEHVKALEKPHHLLPDRGYAYSLEDWLYPAHRLGLFHRLIWVVPPHVVVDMSEEVLAHLRQMDGVRPEEIASFCARPEGGFAGTLSGIDITICKYQELQSLSLRGKAVIDIDTDYFVEVPGDRPWVHPRAVFGALERVSPAPEFVSISRSAGSGFLPLRYRHFADHLAALWRRHEAETDHYDRLFDADERRRRGASRVAADMLEQESLRFPECAATWYLRSGLDPHDEDAIKCREQAARLCSGYRTDLLTAACAYPERKLPLRGNAVRAMEREVLDAPLDPQTRALTRVALGLIHCAVGRVDAAAEHYRQWSERFGSHPGLALVIGKRLLAAKNQHQAAAVLRAALEDDKSRTAALVGLATIHRDSADFKQSLACVDAAIEAAPAWNGLMLLRADILRRAQASQTHQRPEGFDS